MKYILAFLVFPLLCFGQKKSIIETKDIYNFWTAYDKLSTVNTLQDSIEIIQVNYIDKATPYFKRFIALRKFTAPEYVKIIKAYPKFWKTIRPLTEKIINDTTKIQETLDNLGKVIPNFKRPDVCFAIGCLRTGGTTAKNLILMGAEMSVPDTNNTIDKSELIQSKNLIGNPEVLLSRLAHEAIHTQQFGFPVFEAFSFMKHKRLTLLNMSIIEGSADFISMKLLGLNYEKPHLIYGNLHKCELFAEFKQTIKNDPYNYSNWLHNGGANNLSEKISDLGYYIGYVITEDFYNKSISKQKALKTILKRNRYKKVYKDSGFNDKNCKN